VAARRRRHMQTMCFAKARAHRFELCAHVCLTAGRGMEVLAPGRRKGREPGLAEC